MDVELTMKYSTDDKGGSTATAPCESQKLSAKRREAKEVRSELTNNSPEHLDKCPSKDREDVTDIICQKLESLYKELLELTLDLEDEYLSTETAQNRAVALMQCYGRDRQITGMISMAEVCSAIHPKLSEDDFLAYLRSVGVLNNCTKSWNQPFVEYQDNGHLFHCLRIFRTEGGKLISTYQPYATLEGKNWLIRQHGKAAKSLVRKRSAASIKGPAGKN